MALKDTVTKWHTAILYLEDGQYRHSFDKLTAIKKPSAKIIYNLGCINMLLQDYNEAIQYFSESIAKDQYLVVAYFLRAVCYCWLQRYDFAERDFTGILASLPREGINYQQLGAAVCIEHDLIKRWQQASSTAHRGGQSFPALKSIMHYIFRPPKKMVASLNKEDFLGKAKVISSVQEDDILYAEEKKPANSPPQSRHTQPLWSLPVQSMTPGPSRNIPLPPKRKPPHLTESVRENCRRKWKSMEILSESSEKNGLFSSSNTSQQPSGSRPVSDVLDGNENYDHLSQTFFDPVNDYLSLASPLSSSFPVIDRDAKRPVRPPPRRPKIMVTKPDNSQGPSLSSSSSPLTSSMVASVSKDDSSIPALLASSSNHSAALNPTRGTTTPPRPVKVNPKGAPEMDGSPKSVLARAHPSLFQGIPRMSPAFSEPCLRPARSRVQQRSPDGQAKGDVAELGKVRRQLPALPTKPPILPMHKTLEQSAGSRSPKPPRPPPPRKNLH